jgi:hypothetical protein
MGEKQRELNVVSFLAIFLAASIAGFIVRNTLGTASYSLIAQIAAALLVFLVLRSMPVQKYIEKDERVGYIENRGWKLAYATVFAVLFILTSYEDITSTKIGMGDATSLVIIISGLAFLAYYFTKTRDYA